MNNIIKEKEKYSNQKVSVREFKLIMILRKMGYGDITVQKIDNKIIRVKKSESILIDNRESL